MAITWKKLAYEADVITKALITAKGSIITSTAAATPSELGIGTDNYVLTVSTDTPVWEASQGGVPDAHKDSHDPNDGSDALDSAAAAEISVVVAAGAGTGHSFARDDHVHAINHAISDNHIVTMDSADAADDEYARFTANGLESRTEAEFKADYNLQIGTDVLAEQTIGIADDNLVEIDGADIADDEIARFTANGLESRTPAEVAATMALDDVGVPDAAVDFDLQQATDLVVMTVANEAALPAATVAVGQLCWATSELTLHICTADA